MTVRRIFWDTPANQHDDYAGDRLYIGSADDDLLAAIKNGTATVLATIPAEDPNSVQWDDDGVPPGDYQFAATSFDVTGNESDPYQHPGWVRVNVAEPVDTTPPLPPMGGGIEIVS